MKTKILGIELEIHPKDNRHATIDLLKQYKSTAPGTIAEEEAIQAILSKGSQ